MTEHLNVVAVSGGAGFPSTTRALSDLLTQAVTAAAVLSMTKPSGTAKATPRTGCMKNRPLTKPSSGVSP